MSMIDCTNCGAANFEHENKCIFCGADLVKYKVKDNSESKATDHELFDVIMTDTGPEKVKVIVAIREITGLDLPKSKNMADNPPSIIKQNIMIEEAKEVQRILISAGAQVEIETKI